MTRVALAMLLVGGLAGCSGSAVLPGSSHPAARARRVVRPHRAPASRLVATQGTPGCTSAVAQQSPLSRVRTAFVPTLARPLGLVTSVQGSVSFVSTGPAPGGRRRARGAAGAIMVMSDDALAPRRIAIIALRAPTAGETYAPNGRYLLAATGSGAAVIDTQRAEARRRGRRCEHRPR